MVAVCSAPVSTWHLLIGCPPSNLVLLQRDSLAEDSMPATLRSRAQDAAMRGAPAPPCSPCLWDPAQWPGFHVDAALLQPLVALDGIICHGLPCTMLHGPLGLAAPQELASALRLLDHQLAAWPRTLTVTSGGQVLVVAPLSEQADVELVQAVQAAGGAGGCAEGGTWFCHPGTVSKAAQADAPAYMLQRVRARMHELARSVLL